MQAAVYVPGTPELQIVNNFDIPKPGPNQVLLKVQASGLCHSDVFFLSQAPIDPRTYIMGHETSGIAVELGARVHNIDKGKRYVVYVFGGGCAGCLARQKSAQPTTSQDNSISITSFSTFGVGQNGGHAEYAVVDAEQLIPIPDNVSSEYAALMGDSGITAWHAIKTTANIKRGERVLITGIGGLGLLAVQFAVYLGAEVYAVDMRPKSRGLALRYGARKAFDLVELDAELAKGFSVDVAVDFVSTDTTFTREVQAVSKVLFDTELRKSGRITIVGVSDQNLAINVLFPGIAQGLEVRFSQYGLREDVVEGLELMAKGIIEPVITKIPLRDVNKGYNDLRANLALSRVVAIPPDFWQD